MNDITYVGLDVHKARVCVAIAENGRGGEVREVGIFENRHDVLRKIVARLGKQRHRLNFCYSTSSGLNLQSTFGCGVPLRRKRRGRKALIGDQLARPRRSPTPTIENGRCRTARRSGQRLSDVATREAPAVYPEYRRES